MATLRPFRALRPVPAVCSAVASVPYDIVSVPEARVLAAGNPLSFLHVVRPEIDLPVGTDEHADAVYEIGAANLQHYINSEHSVRDEAPTLYVYRLEAAAHMQTGLFGCVSVAEYLNGTIKKHENTRPPKVADRTRHFVTQRAHAEPVMLAYRDSTVVEMQVEAVQQDDPLYDFVASDGVRHTVWRVSEYEPLVHAFADVPYLYIADGHHRCQAAAETHRALGLEGSASFPAVLFPVGQMRILPYNRIVRNVDAALDLLEAQIAQSPRAVQATPSKAGEVRVYSNGAWHLAALPATRRSSVADKLDVARLSEYILEPVFGIEDQRTDPNIEFVGGIRGTQALEERVNHLRDAVAFSMFATSMKELIDVSDADLLMPPKSTWFEPKLRSGILVNLFDK